ncbi:oligosaccharide flippase family protein [Paenibacillus sp. R14(2021)]|uniref:oligosaccharide flippase family protein n=1 Tax=Paenibacillus sp. R14(2021) TaxID=2859228 RepID=UPI001C61165A|nr:oligosaccharide flippase family protein [Paenibacillus sp. R14(2021)]
MAGNKLQTIFQNRLFQNLSVVFSENIITRALNFVIILLLSLHLGPQEYGKYSYLFVNIAFCSALFDFGMENTAVRFTAKDKTKTTVYFGLYLTVKLSILLLICAALILFGKDVLHLLGRSDMAPYLPYFIVGFLGESLLFVNDTYLQAIQRFKLRAIINITRFITSLLFIAALYVNHAIMLKYVCFLFFLPLLISIFFIVKYVLFLKAYLVQRIDRQVLKEIFHYEKWMFMISIPNNTLGRIDFLMISIWVAYDQLGIYNVAFQLSAIVAFLPFVLSKVMLPSMAELKPADVVAFTRKMIKPTLIICAGMLLLIPLARPVITIVLGPSYEPSISILQFMLVSAIIAFGLIPIEQAIYSLGMPKFITVGKCVQILVIVLLITATVPFLGAIWAAISVAIARLLYGVLISLFYRNYTKKTFSAQ